MDYTNIKGCKILVSIRYDLLEKVNEEVKDDGYQHEKFKDLFIPIHWSPHELKILINKRINEVFKRQYEGASVDFNDIFPTKINNTRSFSYLIDRTFNRPRDIIDFFNTIAINSIGESKFTAEIIKNKAEVKYSNERLRAIGDEWRSLYPDIDIFIKCFFKGCKKEFKFNDFNDYYILEFIERFGEIRIYNNHSCLYDIFQKIYENIDKCCFADDILEVIRIFYKIGIIGIKEKHTNTIEWNIDSFSEVEDIEKDCKILIHPSLYKTLKIITNDQDNA